MVNGQDKLKKLIGDTVDGNEDAFAEISEMYLPLTESIIFRYCASDKLGAQDIEDIRQELAIALYDAVLAYDLSQEKVEFGLFAKICMTNRIISRLRKLERMKGREIPTSDDEMMSGDAKANDKEPSLLLIDKERMDSINGLIDRNLSKFEKSVFGLYISGYSSRDMANILGTSNRSVENAVYRIRKKLKELLS